MIARINKMGDYIEMIVSRSIYRYDIAVIIEHKQ
jgi:hypothetical protein